MFASCQTQKTKNEICGKWAYKGSADGVVVFCLFKDNTYEYKHLSSYSGWYEETGVYTINGKNITLTNEKTGSSVLRIHDGNTMYAGDGSKYIKVEDY